MKKLYGIMALAGTLALASCSAEEPGIGGQDPTTDGTAKSNYINVVVNPTNISSSRADNINGTGDYAYGTDDENAVNTIVLGFYKTDGTVVELVNVNSQPQTPETSGNNVALKVPIAVGVEDNTPEQAAWIVAYVNVPEANLSGKNMTEAAQTTLQSVTPLSGYAMTSSVYYGTGLVSGTAVIKDNFYKVGTDSPGAVNLYVERVAAKVTVPTISSVSAVEVYNNAGEAVNLTFTPGKWGVQGTEKTGYVVKQLPSTQPAALTWINNATDFRSYWAQSVSYGATATFLPAGDATVNNGITTTLDYATVKNIEDGSLAFTAGTGTAYTSTIETNMSYIFENTFQASRLTNATDYNPWSAVTSVVITGTYTIGQGTHEGDNITNGTFTPKDGDNGFYLRTALKMGADNKLVQVNEILNSDEAIAKMLNAASGYTVGNDHRALTTADVEMVYVAGTSKTNPANARYLQIKSGVEGDIYLNGSKFDGGVADANASLAEKVNPAKFYSQNKAYFFIPLKHYVAGDAATTAQYLPLDDTLAEGNYGIVRNNWYDLTINKITGLGTGVGSDNDIPLPDPEDDSYAIDAVLNVLQWHMRSQSVDL